MSTSTAALGLLGMASHPFADVLEERAAATGLRYGIRNVLDHEVTIVKSRIPYAALIVVVAGGLVDAADVVIVHREAIRGVACVLSLETLVAWISVLVVVVGILWQVVLSLVVLELLMLLNIVVDATVGTQLRLLMVKLSLIVAAVKL